MSRSFFQQIARANRCIAAVMLAAGTMAVAHADEIALDAARDDYEIGHYQRAFDRLAEMADGGHCEGARLAREMARHGPRLYAMRFEVATQRLAKWHAVPRCDTPGPAHAGTDTARISERN